MIETNNATNCTVHAMGKRILIVDDHALVRMGLRALLGLRMADLVVGEAATIEEAWQTLTEARWDAVLLDILLPDGCGLEMMQRIRKRFPDMPVLMMSALPEENFGIRCLQAGARGFIDKSCAADEIIQAIQRVVQGGRYARAKVTQSFGGRVNVPSRALHEELSEREFQVLVRLANGKSVREIAGELRVSTTSVNTYRTRLMTKLEVRNHAELMKYAQENGLAILMPDNPTNPPFNLPLISGM